MEVPSGCTVRALMSSTRHRLFDVRNLNIAVLGASLVEDFDPVVMRLEGFFVVIERFPIEDDRRGSRAEPTTPC